jgi:hypothetical protein
MYFVIKVQVENCPYLRKSGKCKHPEGINECVLKYSTFYDLCPLAGCIERTTIVKDS